MRVFITTDWHFGIYLNNLDKWINMMEDYFHNFFIPHLKENSREGDILIHLGDLFDNRTSIPIITLNKVEKILKEISDILPVHIIVGNHDIFNKGTNNVNSIRLFSYISGNIFVYERTSTLEIFGKKLVLMPWVEKRLDMIKEIENNLGDYLFCHSDLNGCKMHLNSVAHRNPDKIDVLEFRGYKHVFSGHIHIRQSSENFTFVGSPYQMDRNDRGDQKGITILDLITGSIDFVPNTHSPVFRRFSIRNESDIDKLDELKDTKDYIDLSVSNSLLVNNRKLRRKLELILESGNFYSIEYIDDISGEGEEVSNESKQETVEDMEISIKLDYEEVIRNYISSQKWDSESVKLGILSEFEEVIRLYKDQYVGD